MNEGRRNPRVLLIDDDTVFAALLRREFGVQDIPFAYASSGKEGLEMLKKDTKPNIILLDISMPDMDGFEVLERLQRDPELSEIPVVIMSNFGRESDIEWGKKIGAHKFVEKISLIPSEIVDMACEEARFN